MSAPAAVKMVELHLVPDARTHGVGTALVRTMIEVLEHHERSRVRVSIVAGSPGDADFSVRGGTVGRTNRKSRMHADAESGAGAYSLVWLDVASLDDIDIAEYIGARLLMNTAPRGDLEDEPWVHTPATIREEAAELVAEGVERWALVAVANATGAFAGFTELVFAESAPGHSWQGGTAVRVEHRNHGLGRWLEATMAERLLAERPLVRFVDTENAYSNEPMLNINIAMGFEIVKTVNDWQAPLAAVRTALENKP